jgi:hypothetical protein
VAGRAVSNMEKSASAQALLPLSAGVGLASCFVSRGGRGDGEIETWYGRRSCGTARGATDSQEVKRSASADGTSSSLTSVGFTSDAVETGATIVVFPTKLADLLVGFKMPGPIGPTSGPN